MKKLKKFFRILKRFFTQKKYNIMYYYRCYEKEKIDDKTILLCSQQGQTIDGNIFYILKELQKDKTHDRIVISEDLEAFTHTQYDQIDKFIFDFENRFNILFI